MYLRDCIIPTPRPLSHGNSYLCSHKSEYRTKHFIWERCQLYLRKKYRVLQVLQLPANPAKPSTLVPQYHCLVLPNPNLPTIKHIYFFGSGSVLKKCTENCAFFIPRSLFNKQIGVYCVSESSNVSYGEHWKR